ncbi:hypothetical protein B0H67DRAFT_648866 [Lasiosphaeris hirsuta]|uniref:Uncharacterized protein n=1 Tax=Lasiosphaeris hirsuta TaxID=260670 RepID=A0AA39ZVN5_9PEZI|nr:hypothetical protein B0H67DRAFT_648866 [Lasiosphaeris hirsuta]
MPAVPPLAPASITVPFKFTCINCTIATSNQITGGWIPALSAILSLVVITGLGSCYIFWYTRRRVRREEAATRLVKHVSDERCFTVRKSPHDPSRRGEGWVGPYSPGAAE